jgi:hypothetical protein
MNYRHARQPKPDPICERESLPQIVRSRRLAKRRNPRAALLTRFPEVVIHLETRPERRVRSQSGRQP